MREVQSKAYLVGGAVRDALLDCSVIDRDWVVVGETPESMIRQGFRPVGKDFPVFLHPETNDEYALARTERKAAGGYKGFSVYAAPDVTLEDDLMRRDLTINAIAMSHDGQIIDPFGGQKDLKDRVFRHVSPSFSEDAVRILRVARFAARYHHLGFSVADETMNLMRDIVNSGEVDHLVAERVFAELLKALKEPTPSAFFYTLKDCGALMRIFPEIDCLFGIPQPPRHHPEIDVGIHTLLCLDQAAKLSSKPEVRFAALMHDLGKSVTPENILPHHYDHEENGLPILYRLCDRLRVPNNFKKIATVVMELHTNCHRATELSSPKLHDMLSKLGAFKAGSNNMLSDFLLACEADARGRLGLENREYPQAQFCRDAARAGAVTDISPIINGKFKGNDIANGIRRLRIESIKKIARPIVA